MANLLKIIKFTLNTWIKLLSFLTLIEYKLIKHKSFKSYKHVQRSKETKVLIIGLGLKKEASDTFFTQLFSLCKLHHEVTRERVRVRERERERERERVRERNI